ncbi:MAG: Cytochrome c-type biogenesis protein DsbD, protein-disulfide reductase (EC [uncultured Sulfurovum sp.]|uniref:Cytochrome c-type biogenesis protein DsbD, protein-disulfide reductase (EC) n=1 Tax=uncultured Sulfurovum sp. TaxID=269237 RepID=A0A6S6TMV9_9BACT|nr:MAG: Cytochrome c-type biogenesis protein DsbD, protein-disulfide reductase (EC [uncultured Sulfurovum sp.]
MTELLFGSFISGILLTFTPCVLPMVPIVSGIIIGQGNAITTKKAMMLSLSYVLGTALTYSLMGSLAGATGEQLQSYFQNVWVIGGMSLVFMLMALSMFGLFNLQLPSAIQSKINVQSQRIKGGSLPMVFLLGIVSALILGACVSPILISFLGVAIAKGDALLGGLMMFSMAMGMGIPLLLLGFGAGKYLPKAGIWMNKVKDIFGILLMIVAIQIFTTLHLVSELLVWGVFLLILATYFGAIDNIKKEEKVEKFLKAIGVVLLIWGTILLVGAAKGHRTLSTPLKPAISYNQTTHNEQSIMKEEQYFKNIANIDELKIKQTKAKKQEKPLMIYFYSEYCSLCNKLEATTYKNEKIIKTLAEKYIAVKVNLTDRSNESTLEIKEYFKIFGTPSFIFFDTEGEKVEENILYGYQAPEEFYDTLDLLLE